MPFDRARTDEELRADLRVRATLGREPRDVCLLGSELIEGTARALANRPVLLLADEPTGELDQTTGEQIAELFDRVHQDGTAIVIVTHDQAMAARARRTLVMRDGRIEQVR